MDNTMLCNVLTSTVGGVLSSSTINITPPLTVTTDVTGRYSHPLTVNDNLVVQGDLIINGASVSERLNIIESLLHIPKRDKKYEEKYEKLDKLWKEYEETLQALRSWSTIEESK